MSNIFIKEVNKTEKTYFDIKEFISKNWSKNVILLNENFYKWNFINTHMFDFMDNCLIAIDYESDKIVGFIGVTARNFVINNEPIKGAELTTWIIDENARGNTGTEMLLYLKKKYDVLVAMGISKLALPVYLFNGFKYIKGIPRYVKIYNFNKIKDICYHSNLSKLFIQRQKRKKYILEYNFKKIDYIDKNLDININKNSFIRDWRYLNWRYIKHPFFKYEIYELSINYNYKILVVIRLDIKENYRFGHIVDIIGDINKIINEEFILDFIDIYSKNNELDFIDIYCTDISIGSFFWKNGWTSTLDDIDYLQVPSLFYPIELRIPATTSIVIWSSNEKIYNINKLYITKGDCDLDRPTIEYINIRKDEFL